MPHHSRQTLILNVLYHFRRPRAEKQKGGKSTELLCVAVHARESYSRDIYARIPLEWHFLNSQKQKRERTHLVKTASQLEALLVDECAELAAVDAGRVAHRDDRVGLDFGRRELTHNARIHMTTEWPHPDMKHFPTLSPAIS